MLKLKIILVTFEMCTYPRLISGKKTGSDTSLGKLIP